MKKVLSVFLAAAMLIAVISLAACGAADDGSKENEDDNVSATTTSTRASTPAPSDDDNTEDDDMPFTEYSVGTAEELVAAMTAISNWDVALNSNITLTADIDFTDTEYSAERNTWFAMEEFRGVFDGAGHTIKGLNYERYVENGDLIIDNTNEILYKGDCGLGSAGYTAFGILCRKLNGGTVKNLTIADSTVFMNFNYNRNFRTDVGGLAGMAYNATFENITFANTDLTTSVAININQGLIAGIGLLAGRALGTTTVRNCSADAESEVDGSKSGRFEAGGFIGIYVGNESDVTFESCTSSAYTTVMDPAADWSVSAGNTYNPAGYRASGNAGAFAGGMTGLVIADDGATDVDYLFNY